VKRDESTAPSQRGRPRTAGTDDRILDATLRLLSREGYDGMSIAAVAAEAGVTKPTLYRRWQSKEELVTSAVSRLAATGPDDNVDGDVWERLVAELHSFHAAISRPHGMALVGNVLALEHRHPQLINLYRHKVVAARRARIRAVLDVAQEQGLVSTGTDLDIAINMMIGYYYSARVGGAPVDDGWPARCVDLLRRGLAPIGACADTGRR